VDEGISYVKRALELEPESPFYIDSLAWGYYKQGRCEEALEMMFEVEEMLGKEDEEVQNHIKAIQECIKRNKE